MYIHPADLRHANTRRAFRTLLTKGPCSRADIARWTGVSAVTIGKVIDQMIASQLVEELGTTSLSSADSPSMGRPPRIVSLSRTPRFIGVDLGVRTTTVSALTIGGPLPGLPQASFATPTSLDALIAGLRKAKETVGPGEYWGILVAVPGVLDARRGEVLISPNLHWTEGSRLLREIHSVFNAPVCPVQEVQALALGHHATGVSGDDFLMLDFGDGMGGAVITQGRLLETPLPVCGEIGHTPIIGNSRKCGCGSIGCVETLVAREGLLESMRESCRKPAAKWPDLEKKVREGAMPEWLARSVDAAATAIAGAINILGVPEVVIGGDLPTLRPDIVPMLAERVRSRSILGRIGNVTVIAAEPQRWRGLVVAASERLLLPDRAQLARNPRLAAGVVVSA